MNRKMTYRKLMALVNEGDALICAWERDGQDAIVETYDRQGRAKREVVTVTNLPKDFEAQASV